MMGIIGDIIFATAVVGLIVFTILFRDRNATIVQLTEVKHWHAKGYITKAEVEIALDSQGNLSVGQYEKLRSKVERIKVLRAITK